MKELMARRRLFALAPLALLLTFAPPARAAKSGSVLEVPIGWASVEGGTSGGLGGAAVTVADAKELAASLKGDAPKSVLISGTIVLTDKVRVGSNKTILGIGSDGGLKGAGLHLHGVHNVLIRNLSIHDSIDDAVNIESGSHHIWIDHCDFSQCHDGLVDVKRGSDLVTVSWCRFHDHHKTCLVGHSDKPSVLAEDKGKLRVTFHHNFFDGSQTRHPRVRIAETVHVFNNYYRANEYGVASTDDAGVLVEGNYFEQVKAPTYTQYGDSKQPGRLVERRNVYVESGKPSAAGQVREVTDAYKYMLDETDRIPELVRQGAGVGKL